MTKNNSQAEAWLNKMAKYAKESGSRDITNDMLLPRRSIIIRWAGRLWANDALRA